MIVAKLRGARQRMKLREGRCEGRKPYGEFDREADVIERMRKLRSEGWSLDSIADDLRTAPA